MVDFRSPTTFDCEQGEILEGDIISYGENSVTVEIEGVRFDIETSKMIGNVGDKVDF